MKSHGLVIYPKDIERITGRGGGYARRILRMIKKKVGKEKHQLVTYDEFCDFSGLSMDDLEKYL